MGAESDQLARQLILQEVKKRYRNVSLDTPPPAPGEEGWPRLDDGSTAMRWNYDLPLSHSDNIEQSRKVIVGEEYDGLTVGIILAEVFGGHKKGRQEPKSQPIFEPAAHEAAHEVHQSLYDLDGPPGLPRSCTAFQTPLRESWRFDEITRLMTNGFHPGR